MYFLAINTVKQSTGPDQIGAVIPPHLEWIRKQIADGRVAQAGKWGDRGGMTVIRAGSLSEAEKILGEDPLIRSGLVAYEIAEWLPVAEMK